MNITSILSSADAHLVEVGGHISTDLDKIFKESQADVIDFKEFNPESVSGYLTTSEIDWATHVHNLQFVLMSIAV